MSSIPSNGTLGFGRTEDGGRGPERACDMRAVCGNLRGRKVPFPMIARPTLSTGFNPVWTRRQWLRSAAGGFGAMAFAGISTELSGAVPKLHHAARAKRVIFLFMHGGPSQVDTFDYKPRLQEENGKKLPFEAAPNLSAGTGAMKLMGSPWKFRQHGQSGLWVSELFPEVAKHADDLCVIKSLHSRGQSHGQAVCMIHTGTDNLVRPSVGAWVSYGLGSENRDLPAFVTVSPPTGHGGVRNYGAGFLPAEHQATAVGRAGLSLKKATIRHLDPGTVTPERQRQQLDLLQGLNAEYLAHADGDERVRGVMDSFELAFRMQSAAPEVMDFSSESKAVQESYGIGAERTDEFGRQCLLARRFAEAGVRYIQVSTGFKWDQHGGLKAGHEKNAAEVDRPIAGLLADLKQRGMLDDTLVLWGGEFGRTPITQGSDGRDHNPQGFTMWMAGGGVRGGVSHGETDDYGYFAVKDKVHMHDLHATILHQLGLDHEKLTYRYAGRDFRLTDVEGRVVREILG
jgi:hypothetical protein